MRKMLIVSFVYLFHCSLSWSQTLTTNRCINGLPLPTQIDLHFIGGEKAYRQFLKKNRLVKSKHPLKQLNHVMLSVKIDAQGNLSEIKVLQPLKECPECTPEAIRLIQLVKKWKKDCPMEKKGKNCSAYSTIIEVPFGDI